MPSSYFTLAEMCKSDTAARLGIDNTPNSTQEEALRHLMLHLLTPLRIYLGTPIMVRSGFRCLELNRAIGSGDNSQHVLGEAADIEAVGVSNLELARTIQSMFSFDQLILEFYTPANPHSGWVHVSTKAPSNRKQVLTAQRVEGQIAYSAGLLG